MEYEVLKPSIPTGNCGNMGNNLGQVQALCSLQPNQPPAPWTTASVESQQHSHTANRQLHEGGIWTTEKGRKVISKLRSYAKLKDLLFTVCKEWIALLHLSLILIRFIFTVCLFWTLSVMGNTCFSFEDEQNLIPHLPEHFILQDSCRDLKTSFAKKSTTSYTVAKKR